MKRLNIKLDDNGLLAERLMPGMYVSFSITLEDDTVFTDEGVIIKAMYADNVEDNSYIVSGKKGKTEVFSRDIDAVYKV